MGALLHHIRDHEPLTPSESTQIRHQQQAAACMRMSDAEAPECCETVQLARTRILIARLMREAKR